MNKMQWQMQKSKYGYLKFAVFTKTLCTIIFSRCTLGHDTVCYIWATTKKRYSDTTIQRYTEPEPEPEPELEPCINYANYCLQSPRETSVIIFSGGRVHIPKNITYEVKMRKVIVCKAPLHQMIACRALSMFNRLKYWHAQSDNLAYFFTYHVVDNNIYINCVQDHFTT